MCASATKALSQGDTLVFEVKQSTWYELLDSAGTHMTWPFHKMPFKYSLVIGENSPLGNVTGDSLFNNIFGKMNIELVPGNILYSYDQLKHQYFDRTAKVYEFDVPGWDREVNVQVTYVNDFVVIEENNKGETVGVVEYICELGGYSPGLLIMGFSNAGEWLYIGFPITEFYRYNDQLISSEPGRILYFRK